jgi:hypothetical protein
MKSSYSLRTDWSKMKWGVVLFLYFCFCLAKSCVIWENTKLLSENLKNSTELTFDVTSVDRSRWIGISFTQNSTELTKNSQNNFYFFKHPNQIFRINLTNSERLNVSTSFYFVDNLDLAMDNTVQFKFSLNKDSFKNQEFVLFSSQRGELPKDFQDIFEKKIKIEFKKIRLLYEGNTEIQPHPRWISMLWKTHWKWKT